MEPCECERWATSHSKPSNANQRTPRKALLSPGKRGNRKLGVLGGTFPIWLSGKFAYFRFARHPTANGPQEKRAGGRGSLNIDGLQWCLLEEILSFDPVSS